MAWGGLSMDQVFALMQFVYDNYAAIVGAVTMTLTGLITLAMLIPGEHPDKELQAAVDFIKKLSIK